MFAISDKSGQKVSIEALRLCLEYEIDPQEVEDIDEVWAALTLVDRWGSWLFTHTDDPEAALAAHIESLKERYS